jgi:hypothetical protein
MFVYEEKEMRAMVEHAGFGNVAIKCSTDGPQPLQLVEAHRRA